jgi:hypothetical protein
MVSKLIEKEKKRSLNISKRYDHELNIAFQKCAEACHKQSLINLKESREHELLSFEYQLDKYNTSTDQTPAMNYRMFEIGGWIKLRISTLEEDIRELTKMIDGYDALVSGDEQ